MAYSPLSVANAFIELANEEGNPLTNMKLQKLLYFAEGHHLAHRKTPLMDEVPYAWRYGPVYRSVWSAFRHHGSQEITEPAVDVFDDEHGDFSYPALEASDRPFLKAVWNAYKHKTAAQLSAMSHVEGGPWAEAREWGEDEPISRKSIMDYFMQVRRAANDGPVTAS